MALVPGLSGRCLWVTLGVVPVRFLPCPCALSLGVVPVLPRRCPWRCLWVLSPGVTPARCPRHCLLALSSGVVCSVPPVVFRCFPWALSFGLVLFFLALSPVVHSWALSLFIPFFPWAEQRSGLQVMRVRGCFVALTAAASAVPVATTRTESLLQSSRSGDHKI